jgi:hypothetical protein
MGGYYRQLDGTGNYISRRGWVELGTRKSSASDIPIDAEDFDPNVDKEIKMTLAEAQEIIRRVTCPVCGMRRVKAIGYMTCIEFPQHDKLVPAIAKTTVAKAERMVRYQATPTAERTREYTDGRRAVYVIGGLPGYWQHVAPTVSAKAGEICGANEAIALVWFGDHLVCRKFRRIDGSDKET